VQTPSTDPLSMVAARDATIAPILEDGDHAHRWRIGAQAGPRSQGVCDCGAERSFANSHETMANPFRAGRVPPRRTPRL